MLTKTRIYWAILLTLILVLTGCSKAPQTSQIARQAPEFELKNLNAESLSLSSLKGRLVLINIWATTCPSCVAEMPLFEALQQDWQNRTDVKILMVNLGESSATVSSFLKDRPFTFTVLLDERFDFGQKYNIRYTPTTLIIDQDGLLRASIVGPFKNKAAIQKVVAPYISE
jgi:thiol-disulfide isomerase/thioredoxin